MPPKNLVRLLVVLSLFCTAQSALAESKAVSTAAVSTKNNEAPASDLLDQNGPLDADRAADLRKTGIDLSRLNPQASDVWSDQKLSALDNSTAAFPSESTIPTLQWKSKMPLNPEGWFRGQVQAIGADGQSRIYRLVMSLNTHQALMRAALLRKVGYPVQSPRWYKKLRVQFENAQAKKEFISDLSIEGGLVDHKRWVIENAESKLEVVLQDAMLEPATIVVPTSFYMGNLNATHIKGRRILRSLLVPFVLVDVPESVNMYAWEPLQLVSENLIFTHKYADAFQETTLDDIRWITERIARLTRQDFLEIVNAARYPSDIAQVILEKTIARRNSLVRFTQIDQRLTQETRRLAVNTKVTAGSVQQGKVTQEQYEGYALRFTHGDPESPLRTDDVVRFLKIEGISAGIRQLTTMINENLEILRFDRLTDERTAGLQRQFFDHVKKNPREPYVQPISTWGGPVGGLSLNASRSIVTGSYYGAESSDFRVSLVDQVSAGGRIGYFLGVDGIPKVFPGFGANLSVVRSYVHVRPVPSIEAADKKSWKELWVPGFMKNMAKMLVTSSAATPEDRATEQKATLEKFLEDLQENETFTVTDTLALGENASLTIPLMTLLGLEPVTYANTIVIGAQANQVVLRRTTFTREGGLIKIYLQNIQSQMAGLSIDFNFWMNLTRLSWEKKWGQAQTRAFHLDEKPSDDAKQRLAITAVRAVLQSNNSEILEKNFFPYRLDHRTQAAIQNGKFLFWRWTNIEEWHRVKVQPPKDPEHGITDTKKYERTLFSHRILSRTGKNYYSFLSDILDGLTQNSTFWKPGLIAGASGSNPKDSFFGNAKWSVTTTEGEVTKGKESNPVTTIENYWSGWDLSKKDLFKTLDQIDARVQSLGLGISLIDRNVFNDMLRLQLFEIRSTLLVYEEGLERLRSKLLMTNKERGSTMQRIIGWNSFSGSDDDLVKKVLIPIYGETRFRDTCAEEARKRAGIEMVGAVPPITYIHGQSYECILPWMIEILDLRREYPKNREERIKWSSKVMTLLERNVDLGKLINFIGKENLFYQVKISGFRTRDENGDTAEYKSSTIGSFNNKDRAGVFKDFVSDYQISSSEMNASYLSEGY